MIARFEAERQALALMDHPNIAKVLDAGTTDDGRPYFVMELVKGVSIIQYCDEHRLAPRQRLELFVTVCQAVQHAHQKGIIHRDLKPTNVLVAEYDERPAAMVIDFGVAKAIGRPLTDKDHVHRVRPGDRHDRLHEPGAGQAQPARHRHAHRHLFAGRAVVRAAGRLDPVGAQATAQRRLRRDAADHPRRRVSQSQHAAEHRATRCRRSRPTAAWSPGSSRGWCAASWTGS